MPSTYADTLYTDSTGSYSKLVPAGVYNIKYSNNNYPFATSYFYQRNCYSNQNIITVQMFPKNGRIIKGSYYIGNNISKTTNDTTIIDKGTQLYFLDGAGIFDQGSIIANGLTGDSIYFNRFPNSTAGNIIFSTDKKILFSFCAFNQITISASAYISNKIEINNSTFALNSTISFPSNIHHNISINSCYFNEQVRHSNSLSCTNIYNGCTFMKGILLYPMGINTFRNCKFLNNTITYQASSNYDSQINIYNCLFSNIKNQTVIDRSIIKITNSIFYNNFNSIILNKYQSIQSSVFYLNFNNNTGTDLLFGKMIAVNNNGDSIDTYLNQFVKPLFVDTANFDFRPLKNSPVIDIGDIASVVDSIDFDGNYRVLDGNGDGNFDVDIGPYEYTGYDYYAKPNIAGSQGTAGSTQILKAYGAKLGQKYIWYDLGSEGTILKQETATTSNFISTYSVSPNTTTNYYVCIDSLGIEGPRVLVKAEVANIKTDFFATVDNALKQVVFTNTSEGPFKQFYWNFGNGALANTKDTIVKYNTDGIYTVCLTAIDTNTFKQSQVCKDVNVKFSTCNTSFAYLIDTSKNSVAFTDNSSLGTTNYYWEFGDGYTSTIKNPVHVYTSDGFYNVSLRTVSSSGCINNKNTTVAVSNTDLDCESDFTYSVDLNTHKVFFKNTSKGKNITKYTWDFNTGDTTNTTDPVYSFADGNYYNVCLTAHKKNNKNLTCKKIKVGTDTTYCNANFIYTIDSITKTVKFCDKSFGNINDWNWNFGDGGQSIIQNPSFTYTKAGMYQVYLGAKNKNTGCVSHYNVLINVADANKKLKCVFGYEKDKKFNSKGVLPIEFKGASYGDAAEVEWDFGDGSTNSSSMSPTHEYKSEGKYNVCLTVSDPILNETDQYCKEINAITTNITEQTARNYFSIYPNPATQTMTITFNSTDNVKSIEIVNTIGQTVFTKQFNIVNNSEHLDISSLQQGIYFIKVQTDNRSIIEKIIKQ